MISSSDRIYEQHLSSATTHVEEKYSNATIHDRTRHPRNRPPLTATRLRDAAGSSNSVLTAMQSEGKAIQWEHSYVVQDKTFCVYLAESSDMIEEQR